MTPLCAGEEESLRQSAHLYPGAAAASQWWVMNIVTKGGKTYFRVRGGIPSAFRAAIRRRHLAHTAPKKTESSALNACNPLCTRFSRCVVAKCWNTLLNLSLENRNYPRMFSIFALLLFYSKAQSQTHHQPQPLWFTIRGCPKMMSFFLGEGIMQKSEGYW